MLNVFGFTTGAAVHVAISQIKYVLGINPSVSGAFKIIRVRLSYFIISPFYIISNKLSSSL